MKAPKAPTPAAQRRLREIAEVLRRAVETPLTGMAVPTNRWWVRGVVDALLKLADGVSVNRAFAPPKKTGRPSTRDKTVKSVAAYYRYRCEHEREDMTPGEHKEMLRKALRAANAVSPKLPRLTRATLERYFRRWRQHVLGILEFDGFEVGAVDTDTAKLERILAKRTRGRRQ